MSSALLTSARSEVRQAQLQLEREDVVFRNETPQCVCIEVTVRNVGEERSAPTFATLMAAPLGAFLPWQFLTTLPVPALAPGEATVLRTQALRPAPAPLGPPDRPPTRRLLTAEGARDHRPDAGGLNPLPTALMKSLGQMFTRQLPLAGRGTSPAPGTLPVDPMELLNGPNPHWAGNLNVFLGVQAVERHLAQALRVYPGRTNLAIFFVGSRRDNYRFRLEGDAADWDAALFDSESGAAEVQEDDWVTLRGPRMMTLALRPPEGCPAGSVEVHVEEQSSGRTAVVEFTLDPAAAGPGCYTV